MIEHIKEIFILFRNFDIYAELIVFAIISSLVLRTMTRLKPLRAKWLVILGSVAAQYAWATFPHGVSLELQMQNLCRQAILGAMTGGLGLMGYSILKEYGLIKKLIAKVGGKNDV